MFSPLNDPQVEQWFQRLDAAWKSMPPDVQTRQREEVQQHLESLVAAKIAQGQSVEDAWNAALSQFGDPTQIGRKMYYEWRLSKTGFRADVSAISFGLSLEVVRYFAISLLWSLWFNRLYDSADRLYTHGQGVVGVAKVFLMVNVWGGIVLIGILLGRKYPAQAIKAVFYTCVVSRLWTLAFLAFSLHTHPQDHVPFASFWYWIMLIAPLSWAFSVAIAYLASVTKRGWYRPSWEDFKLAWPKRRIAG